MKRYWLEIIQRLCLIGFLILLYATNFINYYLYDDRKKEWFNTMVSLAGVILVLVIYAWINESLKGKNILLKLVLGCSALYVLINLIVVFMGYSLYSQGVIEIFITAIMVSLAYLAAHYGSVNN